MASSLEPAWVNSSDAAHSSIGKARGGEAGGLPTTAGGCSRNTSRPIQTGMGRRKKNLCDGGAATLRGVHGATNAKLIKTEGTRPRGVCRLLDPENGWANDRGKVGIRAISGGGTPSRPPFEGSLAISAGIILRAARPSKACDAGGWNRRNRSGQEVVLGEPDDQWADGSEYSLAHSHAKDSRRRHRAEFYPVEGARRHRPGRAAIL